MVPLSSPPAVDYPAYFWTSLIVVAEEPLVPLQGGSGGRRSSFSRYTAKSVLSPVTANSVIQFVYPWKYAISDTKSPTGIVAHGNLEIVSPSQAARQHCRSPCCMCMSSVNLVLVYSVSIYDL